MCITCLPLSGELAPSKTYKARRWTWVRNSDPAALADGTLTITQRRSLKPGTKSEDDVYEVAEQQAPLADCRVFFCVNLTSGEVYEVTLGDRGDLCTCDAGRAKVPGGCKHRHALRAVILAGGFEREEVEAAFQRVLSVETVPAPLAPAEECLICGELLAGADAGGEVHADCEAAVTDLLPPIPEVTPDNPLGLPECFRGLVGPWEGVPF